MKIIPIAIVAASMLAAEKPDQKVDHPWADAATKAGFTFVTKTNVTKAVMYQFTHANGTRLILSKYEVPQGAQRSTLNFVFITNKSVLMQGYTESEYKQALLTVTR